MSTDSITAANGATRSQENTRRAVYLRRTEKAEANSVEAKKENAKAKESPWAEKSDVKKAGTAWQGPSFEDMDMKKITSMLGDVPFFKEISSKTNAAVATAASNSVNPLSTLNNYDNSEILNSNINTESFSNAHFSYVAKMTSEPAREPSPTTINHITGSNLSNLLVEVMEAAIGFFSIFAKQIDLSVLMTNDMSMNICEFLSTMSISIGQRQKEAVEKGNEAAKAAAEKAGNCAMWAGIGQCIGAGLLLAASIALTVATYGATAELTVMAGVVFAGAVAGAVSASVMVADGAFKAKAGADLALQARAAEDIQGLVNKMLPDIQYGFWQFFTSKVGGNPAKAEQWFNISSAIIGMFSASAEMMAGKVIEKAAESGTKVAISAALDRFLVFSMANSATSLTGMIGGAVDTDGKAGRDRHDQIMNLWQGLSGGLGATLLYVILEKIPSNGKTVEERLSDKSEYAAMMVEMIGLFLLSMATGFMDAKARSPYMAKIFNNVNVNYYQAKMAVANLLLQTAVMGGKVGASTFISLGSSEQIKEEVEAQKINAEWQRLQECVQSITTHNNALMNYFVKAVPQFFQTLGTVLTESNNAVKSQGRAIRSLTA